jgi:threonine dehydrogenase-like Zn-dependent dehydrogenase
MVSPVRIWVPPLKKYLDNREKIQVPVSTSGVEDLATHKLPLDQAPHAYEIFQKKEDGAIKCVLKP